MNNKFGKIVLLLIIMTLAMIFFALDFHTQLSLENIKAQQQEFRSYYQANRLLTAAIFMFAYIIITAFSLPGAAIMTLMGGALFGLGLGLLLVSFASAIGATLAFLVSRYLLRDSVQSKFGDRLEMINEGICKEGGFYLFTLRLIPLIPFFVINLVMGLTPIKTWVFYIVSQIGMLPGTVVYVNAGTQVSKIESLGDIVSLPILLSFLLLGIFPLFAKKIMEAVKARKVLQAFNKPARFDYNLVVIGGGSAGLVTSYIAAAIKAKVALIEKGKMGGDCLNYGCVPSKALIRSAKMLAYGKRGQDFGLKPTEIAFNFADVMQRVQQVIRKIEPHDSVERYTQLGVECIQGEARITSPWTVEVNGRSLNTKNIVIASGGQPFVPPIKGIEHIDYLTSDNIWEIRQQPERLVVLGGGPIGSELTQAFARLGSKVTQVEMMSRIMLREDEEISAMMRTRFEAEGVRVLTDHKAIEVLVEGEQKVLLCEHQGQQVRIEFDALLVAVGRSARSKGFGLEELGVEIRRNGTLEADEFMQTNFPNIYCAGDVAGPYQFTHVAGHQAWYAAVNSLFSSFKRFKVNYDVIPWATFTDPEVARVGLNETEAKQKGIDFEVTRYDIDDLDRAIADSEDHGFVKVITKKGSDKILGATIVGTHAGDLIAEYILAMKHGIGLNKILGTIHIYPTLAEANKYAAGEWKKAHVPEKALKYLEKFHAWRRG